MLIPFPIAFFVSTLVCDLSFWRTGNPIWATAALWLLGTGIVMATLAAAAGLTDFLGDRRIRDLTDAWWHFLGNLIVVILELINWYRRYEGGDAAAGPIGEIPAVPATEEAGLAPHRVRLGEHREVGAEDQPVAKLHRADGQGLEQVRVLGHGRRLAHLGLVGRGRLS